MSERTGIRSLVLLLLAVVFVFAPASRAQTDTEETPGINSGNYNVQESIELGYRKDWLTGNQNTFHTFVDLNTGLRLLDYNLSMRSINHQGILFDNLTFSNFGYGGDPENVSRLRIQKNKWYDFSYVFRRHKNFWDYSLLGNPLIPTPLTTASPLSSNPLAFPAIAVNNSPAALYLVRRMQDFGLTLLPESRVRVRLGYSRYVNEGPSLNAFAGTTNFLLEQNFRMTTNAYHVGVDFRVLPRTTISYDQFLEYNKQDTSDTLANTPYLVQTPTFPGTVPVNMGISWYYQPLTTGTPCGASLALAPFPTATATTLGYANPACKLALSYSRTAPGRVFMPTERLSFQSTYFKRLEMSGSASYNSSNDVLSNLNDSINEWTNPSASGGLFSQLRQAIVSGPAKARQVAGRANWSGIVSLTQKVRLVDSFNYDNWRTAGVFNQVSTNLFAQYTGTPSGTILSPMAQFVLPTPVASGPTLTLPTSTFASICPAPYTAATCPQHAGNSGPDQYSTYNATFLGQRRISNSIQIQADLTKHISGRIGYLYEQRQISETPWLALYPSNTTVPNMGAIYYPGGGGTPGLSQTGGTATGNYYLAARGACLILTGGALPAGCTLQPDGSIKYAPTLTASTDSATYCQGGTQNSPTPYPSIQNVFLGRCMTTINEHVGLAGLTLRPMDTLRIYADFEFGYNDVAYARTLPRQIQSYKVHADYKPRTWMTIDGSVDIRENRDNVINVNDLEHTRTYGLATILARNSNLAVTIGYNYTNLFVQNVIAFRDNFSALMSATYAAPTGGSAPSPTSGYLFYTPTNSACAFTTGSGTGAGTNASVNLCTTAFYTSRQHYAYGDVMWKPLKRVTATLEYAGSFVGGSTGGLSLGSSFNPVTGQFLGQLNPLQPGGTLAFNYQKPSASIQIDIYKGLSYRTTWNYYAYQSRAPLTPSVTIPTIPAGTNPGITNNGTNTYAGQTYALQPITAPDFNGNMLMFALRYAF